MQGALLKDTLKVVGGAGFARGFSLLNTLIIARYLGPEGFGQFSIYYAFLIFTWHSSQGFDTTYIRYATVDSGKSFLQAALFLKTVYTLLLVVAGVCFAGFVAEHFYEKADLASVLRYAFLTGGALVYLRSAGTIFQHQGKFGLFASINTVFSGSVFFILASMYAMSAPLSLEKILKIYLVVGGSIGILSLLSILRYTQGEVAIRQLPLATTLKMGKWILGITMLNYIFQKVDVVVLTRYSSYSDVGAYGAAVHMLTLVMLLTNAVSQVFLPQSMRSVRSQEEFLGFTKESLLLIVGVNLLVLCMILWAPFILQTVYGTRYVAAATPLRILLAGVFITNFYRPFSFIFYALEDAQSRFLLELCGVFLATVLLIVWVPTAPMTGASMAKTVSVVAIGVISSLVLGKRLKRHFQLINTT